MTTKTGDALLRRFALRVRQARPQTDGDLAAIGAAFEAILAGADPGAALGIAPKRGRKVKRISDYPHGADPISLAIEVLRAHRAGLTVDAAKDQVSKTFAVARTTLDGYWKDNARLVRGWLPK